MHHFLVSNFDGRLHTAIPMKLSNIIFFSFLVAMRTSHSDILVKLFLI